MSRDIRSKTSLFDASLMTGAIALPMVVPRPVVNITADLMPCGIAGISGNGAVQRCEQGAEFVFA